jgi:chloramphenicol O-acetyltransferase
MLLHRTFLWDDSNASEEHAIYIISANVPQISYSAISFETLDDKNRYQPVRY